MWQHFFKHEKKNLNPYIYKMNDHADYIIYVKEKMDQLKGKWNELFQNDNPLFLEIGSGAGNFTVRNAEKYQKNNYIGVELRFKRLVHSARKAEKRNLKNIVFLRRNGNEITEFFGKNEIDGIYINFPDPWEKKVKNRIIQEAFFQKISKIMKKGGKIYFKTDHDEYYEDVLEKMKQIKDYDVVYHTNDLHHSSRADENIFTEFEELFTKKDMKINYIEIEKEV